MLTPWSSSHHLRVRPSAGPLRVLWVALLVFTFLYSHGVSTEGVRGHLQQTASAVMTVPDGHEVVEAAPVDHQGGHGASHPAEECTAGYPQQSPTLEDPHLWALPMERLSPAAPFAFSGTRTTTSPASSPHTSTRAIVVRV
ncbi:MULTISPECIES: hypothetical protein [Streptomyces]|uniref:hypothetical protein n=1 Tax=Streptomyces TaxID=1883 RepID=UPI0022539059|nr:MULTISPECIES: hypothetical protein [Streptomyces]MCX5277707.1 hypothetical protein [Streptomyces virginiae]MCX5583054.1 hypothetical protein [Streptomyces erythrochromogenes]